MDVQLKLQASQMANNSDKTIGQLNKANETIVKKDNELKEIW